MNPDLRVVLVCATGLFVLTYGVPVFRLKRNHRSGAHLNFIPSARDRLDARFPALIDPLLAALGHAGFTVTGYLDGPGDPGKRSGIRCTIVLRAADGVTGAIVYVIERATAEAVRLTTAAQFTTDFADGGSVSTGNSEQPALFRYPAGRRVYRFPGIASVGQLYDLHRRILARAGAAPVTPQPVTLEEVMLKIQETTARTLSYQEEVGDYVRTADGDYGLTWKGAIRAVAIMGPGVKRLWQERQRARAADLIAELRREPPPV